MTKKEPDKKATPPKVSLNDAHVLRYLKEHPQFLKKHPELLSLMTPPERSLGDAVVDFQHFQLKNLQQNSKQLKDQYEGLVDFCRDNLSTQAQIHEAVLRIIRARGLEQLLEVLAIDLPSLFGLDIVRLCVEGGASEVGEQDLDGLFHSGIVLVDAGAVDATLGNKDVLLVADTEAEYLPEFDEIFVNARSLGRSCAILKLPLLQVEHPAMLALGVRSIGHFHAAQGVELLVFLSHVIAAHMDRYLVDLAI